MLLSFLRPFVKSALSSLSSFGNDLATEPLGIAPCARIAIGEIGYAPLLERTINITSSPLSSISAVRTYFERASLLPPANSSAFRGSRLWSVIMATHENSTALKPRATTPFVGLPNDSRSQNVDLTVYIPDMRCLDLKESEKRMWKESTSHLIFCLFKFLIKKELK